MFQTKIKIFTPSVKILFWAFSAFFILAVNGCKTATVLDVTPYKEASKKWEKEISELEAKDKVEKDPVDGVIFYGSSSIRLWKNIHNDMTPYPVIQRGYGGSSYADMVFYTERILKPHNFKALALFAANDITGSPTDRKPEEVKALVKEIIRQVRTFAPKKPIFIIEVTPTNSRWKVWSEIKKVNALLKDMCEKGKNLYFIETANAYLNAQGTPRSELFLKDQLHQTQEGYDIWASLIKKRFDEVLK